MPTPTDDYVLGRGIPYFDQFVTGTKTKTGERDFGNCPGLSFNVTVTKQDHFSSRSGTRQKDRSVVLETTRAGQLITDNISTENLALALLGSTTTLTTTSATITDEAINGGAGVTKGLYYQIGATNANPGGATDLDSTTAITVKVASTVKTLGTDYTVNYATGRLYIVDTGTIANNSVVTVTYKTKAGTRKRVVSGSTSIEGALRFIADNPEGKNKNWYMPYVKLTTNGDVTLIGDQEFTQITFDLEILTLDGFAAVYCDDQVIVA